MTWNRHKRFAIVLFALVNLLFMQLAVAAYVCPAGVSGGAKTEMADMKAAGMPCAESMAPHIAKPTSRPRTNLGFPLLRRWPGPPTITPCFASACLPGRRHCSHRW